ncbi:MAG TPA: prepilin-type N-terminal cleavage/methylation domain-containing protein [Patescibacteria group bacterium]|nr:prepilin-type N-terminal cleavage/methylation domain-containing protein [Patescibacteria group bacterium]
MRYISQTGDTIIEVLITMAILGLVLAGAYAATSHSLNTIYGAQQRIEALKLVEGQIERLDVLSNNATQATMGSTSSIFGAIKIFCLDSSSNVTIANSSPVGGLTINGGLPALQTDTLTSYVPTCSLGPNSTYFLSIERYDDAGPNTGAIFKLHVRWASAAGSASFGKDEVIIRYRLNRPLQ